MRCIDHVAVVVGGVFNGRRDLEYRRLTEHDCVREDASNGVLVFSVIIHEPLIGEIFSTDRITRPRIFCEIFLFEESVGGGIPDAVLSPNAFAKLPSGPAFPFIPRIVIAGWQPCYLTLRVDQLGAGLVWPCATNFPNLDFARSSRTGKNCLPCSGRCTFLKLLLRRDLGNIFQAHQTSIGFVHALPTNDDFLIQTACFLYS